MFLELEMLVKAASTVLILTYILANLCVIILRESKLLNYRPQFLAPLYPWLQIGGIIAYAILLIEMGLDALLISTLLILSGLFFYWFYGRIKTEREYALLHLIERISDRELSSGILESELKNIIRERDELCIDRFEQIVERAAILDIPESQTRDRFFRALAEQLQKIYNLDDKFLLHSLLEREKAGSTKVLPNVAVSDIVLDGKGFFEMAMVRCRGGVIYDSDPSRIHAFFLLLTTADERDFYMRAVASIAQIIQENNFEKKWLETKNTEGLKDLVLLSERKRSCEIS
jgi:mannitol/fructose-specific phosphotransferase system IIA component (Ntr-type)